MDNGSVGLSTVEFEFGELGNDPLELFRTCLLLSIIPSGVKIQCESLLTWKNFRNVIR